MGYEVHIKFCPVCSAKCEKSFLFLHEFYWKCPRCKIDADDPKYGVPKTKPIKAWDDEMTDPAFKSYSKLANALGGSFHKTQLVEFPVTGCAMTTIMSTRDPITGVEKADVKITSSGLVDGIGKMELFQETFEMTQGNTGTEDSMWEDLYIKILFMSLSFSIDHIKEEYLKLRLQQRYPNGKIVIKI